MKAERSTHLPSRGDGVESIAELKATCFYSYSRPGTFLFCQLETWDPGSWVFLAVAGVAVGVGPPSIQELSKLSPLVSIEKNGYLRQTENENWKDVW